MGMMVISPRVSCSISNHCKTLTDIIVLRSDCLQVTMLVNHIASLRVAVPTPRGKTFFLGGWVRLHVGYHIAGLVVFFLSQ